MLRRLFTLASALSLVLCAAALIALPLSYGWPLKIDWLDDFYGFIWKRQWAIVSCEGTVEVRRFLPDFPDYQANRMRGWHWNVIGGIGYSRYAAPRSRGWIFWIQYWFIIVMSVPVPLVRFGPVLWRRFRDPLNPLECRRCGYDLRATPDRCPECGHVAEKLTA